MEPKGSQWELPRELNDILRRRLGDDAPGVISEMNSLWRELGLKPLRASGAAQKGKPSSGPPRGEVTHSSEEGPGGYSPFSMTPIGAFNPSTISLQTMGEMMRDGLVSFILDIRAMPIIGLFRQEPGSTWDVECDNPELEEVCRRALGRLMQRLVAEAQTARPYGFYCAEKVWELVTYQQLSVDAEFLEANGVAYDPNKVAWVYEKVKGNAPGTIKAILRNKQTDQFAGYEQYAMSQAGAVLVPADKALVVTYRKQFGNLYGQALLERMYVPWWWLQFVWRALLRYLDRMGTPVAVCYAPSDEDLKQSDGSSKAALDVALEIAKDIGKSNAAAVPSNQFPTEEGGGPKWRLEYLTDDQRAGQMIDVRRDLETWLFRSAGVPEKIVGASSDSTGAYAAWRVPFDLFMQNVETDLSEFLQHANDYLLPPLGLYNAGEEYGLKGKVRLVAENIDRTEAQQALEVAQEAMKSGHPDAAQLDLLRLFEQAGLPVKEDAEPASVEPTDEEPGSEGEEDISGPEDEDSEGEPADDVVQKVSERAAGQRGFGSMALSTMEVLLVLAQRELRETGKVTIQAGSLAEVKSKAALLRKAGLPSEVAVRVELRDTEKGRQGEYAA